MFHGDFARFARLCARSWLTDHSPDTSRPEMAPRIAGAQRDIAALHPPHAHRQKLSQSARPGHSKRDVFGYVLLHVTIIIR